ncbi:YjcZ family sporulation protein, partial [Bacillus sp. B-TM1]
ENVCGGTITWYLKHVQNGVALLVVLFILLIIIGCSCFC